MERKSCRDVDEEVACCNSCHDDSDSGFMDLQEIEKDGYVYVVCCTVADVLEPS